MQKFLVDPPLREVIRVLEHLGFRMVRNGNHIAMLHENPDSTRTPLTIKIIEPSKAPLFAPS